MPPRSDLANQNPNPIIQYVEGQLRALIRMSLGHLTHRQLVELQRVAGYGVVQELRAAGWTVRAIEDAFGLSHQGLLNLGDASRPALHQRLRAVVILTLQAHPGGMSALQLADALVMKGFGQQESLQALGVLRQLGFVRQEGELYYAQPSIIDHLSQNHATRLVADMPFLQRLVEASTAQKEGSFCVPQMQVHLPVQPLQAAAALQALRDQLSGVLEGVDAHVRETCPEGQVLHVLVGAATLNLQEQYFFLNDFQVIPQATMARILRAGLRPVKPRSFVLRRAALWVPSEPEAQQRALQLLQGQLHQVVREVERLHFCPDLQPVDLFVGGVIDQPAL